MSNEPSGDYYDYTKTMQPERPWLVEWHQKYVYRIMHARRGGTGTCSADPEMAAARPPEHRYVFGDGKISHLYLTFEDALEVIRGVYEATCGVPQVVLLTGWQFEGHDSKYPSWASVNKHLKRDEDETALESLRWLIREARQYNCLATLHINMFDAYADSPLFDEYATKDILARDKEGKLIVGNRWWGMDCYHVSYTQEWKHGLAQRRIDRLIEMVPEIQENHCVYVDAMIGARVADQQGPISPYLGYSKEEEARTMRKIFRYWRDREIDVAGEHVHGIRVDRFIGLQPHTASQMEHIEDIPDELMCGNPAHFGFESINELETFIGPFWREFLPWFNRNHAEPVDNPERFINDGDLCMPCRWCETPTLIVYSESGCENKTFTLPDDWPETGVLYASEPGREGKPREVSVEEGTVTLTLA
ncbi:MAG: endo-alpha-N-acetylgalactosaminidase family protein, partial [Phycisphaeraceae bacterium]|nr:endo-alpha-N-acetylgalactosaminidase family protein [Phycisphaeraceae bacterium]